MSDVEEMYNYVLAFGGILPADLIPQELGELPVVSQGEHADAVKLTRVVMLTTITSLTYNKTLRLKTMTFQSKLGTSQTDSGDNEDDDDFGFDNDGDFDTGWCRRTTACATIITAALTRCGTGRWRAGPPTRGRRTGRRSAGTTTTRPWRCKRTRSARGPSTRAAGPSATCASASTAGTPSVMVVYIVAASKCTARCWTREA